MNKRTTSIDSQPCPYIKPQCKFKSDYTHTTVFLLAVGLIIRPPDLTHSSMDLERGGSKKPPSAPPPAATAAASTTSSSSLLQLRDRLVALQPIVLRASALLATAVAAAVMGLNTQSYTTVVAIVGTRPLMQTFTAKFRDTPPFVYFVIANAIACAYNLAVLLIRRHVLRRRTASLVVHMLDMVITVLLATGAAAAASMAYLGKKGNLHARWNPICDKFGSFCSRGGIALVSSFVGVALMLTLNLLSAAAASVPRPNAAAGR